MTRLIEALKKAEEAKRKGETPNREETPKKSQDFSLELEDPDAPNNEQDELEYSPERHESSPEHQESSYELQEPSSGLSIESEPSDTDEPHSDEYDSKTAENNVFEPAPTYQVETEHQSTVDVDIATDDSASDDIGRRLTDQTTSPHPGSSISATNRNKRLGIFALFALLLFGGVFAVLYWQLNSQSTPYTNLAPDAQNRGFLDSSGNQGTTEPNNVGETEADSPSQPQPQTQTTIGPAVSEPPENPNQPEPDETISAVNALIAAPAQTSSEPPVVAQRTAVFNIENVQQVPGSEDSFAFTRANMQQGEWKAARSELEALLRAQPTSRRALVYLAQVHVEMGNFSQAERTYARILQLDPQNSVAQAGLIRVAQTDSLDYQATLQSLQNNYPDKAFIPYMLGNHFAGQQRWNEAAGAYRQAVTLAESFGEIPAQYVYNLAIALERLRRSDEALAQYRRAENLITQGGNNNIDIALLNTRIERLETSLGQ